jgi:hypothetical protein
MKVQYFSDEHDFRKYVLLRLLAKMFNIGVCWMLTPDDGGQMAKSGNISKAKIGESGLQRFSTYSGTTW